jgi:hypothetical protein
VEVSDPVMIIGGQTGPGAARARAALFEALQAANGPPVFEVGRPLAFHLLPAPSGRVADALSSVSASTSAGARALDLLPETLRKFRRLVLVLPLDPGEWYQLGVLHGSTPGTRPRLAILLGEDALPAGRGLALPTLILEAEVTTDDPDRVVAWLAGRLFSNLLPPVKAKEH